MRKKALTLAEIAMALVIAAIVIAAITAGFASTNARYKLTKFAEELGQYETYAMKISMAEDHGDVHTISGAGKNHIYGGPLGIAASTDNYNIAMNDLPFDACVFLHDGYTFAGSVRQIRFSNDGTNTWLASASSADCNPAGKNRFYITFKNP